MASLEHIDLELGEALECMMGAAGDIRLVDTLDTDTQLKRIGRATMILWEIREDIYRINPNLRVEHAKEIEEDKARFESLSEIHSKACTAEDTGRLQDARAAFAELLAASQYGHFTRLAEAGLYRTMEMGRSNKTNA